ncbi:ERI1 exoribonuclease 2 [Oryzias melastigma]|uniref:ERI1 exoribonuclease 2 n=1 Tax=Oryzias melastigma TaxID=30732 RepID=A0A834FLG8_ORYME|nr:ERI1 exoribonuclease 2 [Oryzias melastigma]
MSTKKLAKTLGLVKQRSKNVSSASKRVISNQIFSYLIVIDFESTCWREKNNYSQEIIEFPAVLLNTSTGDIDSEFHTFVQPQEHPILSEFCTELTGITQVQVEAGIPLQICLPRFNRWLQSLQLEMGFTFPNKQQTSSASSSAQKLCTFVTWSDWDLGVCLQYECKRKQLHKPDVLNNWIDLRSTYRMWYNRKPKGLNGALQDLGLLFNGREHSGLDDAKNTARLAAKMMRDGCVMKITRSLDRTPVVVQKNATHLIENTKEKLTVSKNEDGPSTSKSFLPKVLNKACQKQTFPEKNNESSASRGGLHFTYKICSKVRKPHFTKNITERPTSSSSTVGSHSHTPAARMSSAPMNLHSTHNSSSHVLCSTTISCLTDVPQANQRSDAASVDDMEDVELLVDPEERCGSYDDVVLECGENEGDSEFHAGICDEEESENSHSSRNDVTVGVNLKERGTVVQRNLGNILQNSLIWENKILVSTRSVFNPKKEMTNLVKSDHCFAVPKPVNWRKQNQSKIVPSPKVQEKSYKNNTKDVLGTNFLVSKNISTLNIISSKPKPDITKHVRPLNSPLTIYSEPEKRSSSVSLHTPNNVLSTLPTNSFSSHVNRSCVSGTTKGQKMTSPLCACGRRAKRQVVSNGGPNHGRGFYCCPVRRSGGKGKMEKRCDFFKWESALMKSNAVDASVFRSSMSFCHMNSSLSHYQPNKAQLRKSC